MTRTSKSTLITTRRRPSGGSKHPGYWLLQDAKARFSDLVRRVKSEGPQHVTVRGREEVVVISVDEFRRLKGGSTGKVLTAVMQASPCRDVNIEPTRTRLPVREIAL
jgi:prevent-host-death family protein